MDRARPLELRRQLEAQPPAQVGEVGGLEREQLFAHALPFLFLASGVLALAPFAIGQLLQAGVVVAAEGEQREPLHASSGTWRARISAALTSSGLRASAAFT